MTHITHHLFVSPRNQSDFVEYFGSYHQKIMARQSQTNWIIGQCERQTGNNLIKIIDSVTWDSQKPLPLWHATTLVFFSYADKKLVRAAPSRKKRRRPSSSNRFDGSSKFFRTGACKFRNRTHQFSPCRFTNRNLTQHGTLDDRNVQHSRKFHLNHQNKSSCHSKKKDHFFFEKGLNMSDATTPEEYIKTLPDRLMALAQKNAILKISIKSQFVPLVAADLMRGLLNRVPELPEDNLPAPTDEKISRTTCRSHQTQPTKRKNDGHGSSNRSPNSRKTTLNFR